MIAESLGAHDPVVDQAPNPVSRNGGEENGTVETDGLRAGGDAAQPAEENA